MTSFTSPITSEQVTMLPAGDAELATPEHCECLSDACLRFHTYEACGKPAGEDGLCAERRQYEALSDSELLQHHERRAFALFDYRLSKFGLPEGFGVVGWIRARWNEERKAAFRTARRQAETV